MTQTQCEPLYTYQDLAERFKVCVRTIQSWFADYTLFRPTRNTVRVPETVLKKFISEHLSAELSGKPDGKADKIKGTRRPGVRG